MSFRFNRKNTKVLYEPDIIRGISFHVRIRIRMDYQQELALRIIFVYYYRYHHQNRTSFTRKRTFCGAYDYVLWEKHKRRYKC